MKKSYLLCMAIGLVALVLLVPVACKKQTDVSSANIPAGQQRVNIFLSDNPVNFDAVYVDIQQVIVQVIPDSCQGRDDNHNDCFDDNEFHCSTWDTLDIRPGVYNLLTLSNGTDTLLANGLTLSGRVNKIKLVLGSNNSVVIDSVNYPLELWGNSNSVTIQVHGADITNVNSNDLQLWLDFDASGSIVRINNNHFTLRPRIRIFVPSQTSTITGKVLPGESKAVVAAIADGDTLVAFPQPFSGKFKIRGLRGTSADLFINATANGYQDTTITGVAIQHGTNTDIGTVTLHN